MKDLLSISDLTKDEINRILLLADSFKEVGERSIKKVPTLRGRTIVNFFAEPSTRTRASFELAAKRLSADVINISAKSSSLTKGETLTDTAKTIEALGADAIIIRHASSGAAELLANRIEPPVINGGDGSHEHPTQALLDLYTIKEKKGTLLGLKVGIVGDISHSRVARSNILAFTMMGADVVVVGPSIMMPKEIEKMGVAVSYDLDKTIAKLDVIYMLRIQNERERGALLPSIREYARLFALNQRRLDLAGNDLLIMHPGPMNPGVEISLSADHPRLSSIWDQVKNGLAVRMATLCYALEGRREDV